MSTTPKNTTCILRLPKVKQQTGLSRSSIYEMMARGEFPQKVPLGPRSVGWVEVEVADWIADRINRRSVDKRIGGGR